MTKHEIVGHVPFLSCILLSCVSPFSGVHHEETAGGSQRTFDIHGPVNQVTELREVVFVIQSQKNSYHLERAQQRRAHLYAQEQSLPDVVLLHEVSEYNGNCGILPALPRLAEGYCLDFFPGGRDRCQFNQSTAGAQQIYPLETDYTKHVPPKSDFTIDLKHEIALYIWDKGRGPPLTAVCEFCAELRGSPNTKNCATTVNSYLPSCFFLSACSEGDLGKGCCTARVLPTIPTIDLGVPNTESVFPDSGSTCPDEAVSIGECYGFALSNSGYSYITGGGRMVFSRVAVLRILSSGCGCYNVDAPDDMVLGRCLNTLGLSVTHSPQFHQARPDDYPKELLLHQSPISFHKHWNINPVAVYQQWLLESEEAEDISRVYRQEI